MRIQPAFLTAVVVSFMVPFLASADDEQHSPGVKEVYIQRAVPPNTAVRIVPLRIEPHEMIGRHCHSGDEIGIVTEGTVMMQVGDAEYEEKHQGEWFKVDPNMEMTVKNDTEKTARLYSVLVVEDDGKWLKHDPKDCPKK